MERDQLLGAEGYIPQSLLSEIALKKVHVNFSFAIDPKMSVTAKSFAVSFYKDLRRLGFSEDQIADFSTELLKCLQDKLEAYKNKIQQKSQDDM